MLYGYARVSSHDQNLERQIISLLNAGVEKNNIKLDKLSGKDTNRPELQNLLSNLKENDTVVITSLDRLSRKYDDCISLWNIITKKKKANIKVLNFDLLDTTTRKDNLTGAFISDLVLQIIAYVSEIERNNIKERQREGIAIARAKGKFKGRKKLMTELQFLHQYEKILKNICSVNQLCKELGITKTTYYRYYKEYIEK